jgi:DNA replication protein DnaC
MNEELIAKLKYLRLGGLLAHWDEYLQFAAEKNFSHGHLLTHLVEEEYRLKQTNARAFRRLCARIPEPWVIETFPFERQPKLNRKKIMALYDSGNYLQDHQNIIWLGGTGVGKTGLATSFLIHALDQGYRGRYVQFAQLIAEFYGAAADHSEEKVLKSYLAWDCLLIDEIGYVEVEPAQVGLFFTLMQQRHKKKPTLITSNLGFSEWGSFLKNDHLSAALIDRLTENSHVFNLKGGVTLRSPISSEP